MPRAGTPKPKPPPPPVGTQPAASGAVGGTSFPSHSVPPQPIKTVEMPYERAHRLATMPRKKWDENTWSAFWAAIAALPGAGEALHSGAGHQGGFSLSAFEVLQVVIFVGFAVWFLVARLSRNEQTAQEYLNELYALPQPERAAQRWKFWR